MPDFILNPKTNRYVKRDGDIGQKLINSHIVSPPEKYVVHKIHHDEKIPQKSVQKVSDKSNSESESESEVDTDKANYHVNLIGKNDLVKMGNEISSELTSKISDTRISRSLDRREKELDDRERILNIKERDLKLKEREIYKLIKSHHLLEEPVDSVEKKDISKDISKDIDRLPTKERIMYIYTDGAVSNNTRGSSKSVGGIGIYFGRRDPRNLGERFLEYPVTNQRAEIWAIVRALQIIIDEKLNVKTDLKIVIYSDSMYALNILNGSWNAKENRDLVNIGLRLMKHIHNIELKHIRAHTGKKDIHSKGNDMADKLAQKGKLLDKK